MSELYIQIEAAVKEIRTHWQQVPTWGIVLGSGLGGLADYLEVESSWAYDELPHFVSSTAVGHHGRLLCGRLGGQPVCAMQGRFHLYEGWSPSQASFPVRVMKQLGAQKLLLSNAAGGVNPQYRVGDIVVIEDQINLMFRNPLMGVNDDRLGPRFPDMSSPYDKQLSHFALATARQREIVCHQGVYVGMLGPTYETRAEYRMVRQIGGDVVGMSTVPETIAARHMGMRVLALSVITNDCYPDVLGETSGEEVVAAADATAAKLATLAKCVVT